jgi:hypothetical protein
MTEQPERIWAWHHAGKWGCEQKHGKEWSAGFGLCRPNNRYPLQEIERTSGAEYIRADLVEKMKESHEKTS